VESAARRFGDTRRLMMRASSLWSGSLFALAAGLMWGLVFIGPLLLPEYPAALQSFGRYLAFGLIAQLFFTARFLVQWIASERAGNSVVPMAFWFCSMGGGLMTLVYGIVKREPVIIVGQSLATIIYVRNIMLIWKNRGSGSKTLDR
jgi:lipid-A-disaccharide synthase-like uncharacterized protein